MSAEDDAIREGEIQLLNEELEQLRATVNKMYEAELRGTMNALRFADRHAGQAEQFAPSDEKEALTKARAHIASAQAALRSTGR